MAIAEQRDENFRTIGELLIRMENTVSHIVLNADGIIQTWSEQATTLFGWTADEAVGKVLADLLVPPELRAAHLAGLQRWKISGTGVVACKQIHSTAVCKDGSRLPVSIDIQVIIDDAGHRFLGWVKRAADGTQYG